MKIVDIASIAAAASMSLFPMIEAKACDDLIGGIITRQLTPVIASAGCPGPDKAGMDKPDHKLTGVCYESSGATSHLRIDGSLTCHGSSESVVSKIGGSKTTPSVSENVAIDADIRGADCSIQSLDVKPSGEVGKLIAQWFDANGKARQALEQALNQVCKK